MILLTVSGCRVEQDETAFNDVIRAKTADGNVDLTQDEIDMCIAIENQDECEAQESTCQPVLNVDEEYLSCINIPKSEEPADLPEDSTVVADGANESEEESEEDKVAKEEMLEKVCKGKKQILICHIPSGNILNAHSICLSENGWLNGHQEHHGNEESRDHLGACGDNDLAGNDEAGDEESEPEADEESQENEVEDESEKAKGRK